MEFRYKLRMMGIRVKGPSILLIDNASVVANTTLPSSTLKKKHNSIAYHRMREAVAAGIIKVGFIPSKTNTADILTKPIGPAEYWNLLSEVMYGRDRGIKGELQGFDQRRDLARAKSSQGSPRRQNEVRGTSSTQERNSTENYSRMSARSRHAGILYVESQISPDSRCYQRGPQSGASRSRRNRRDAQRRPRKRDEGQRWPRNRTDADRRGSNRPEGRRL